MRKLPSFLAVAVAVACSDTFQPTVDNMAGDYTARTFTITDTAGTTDLLKAGAVLTLSLIPRGTTVGYLYIPALRGDSGIVADMTGTWTMSEGIILVDQTVDTFVRDLPFFAYRRELYADKTFGGVRVKVILMK